MWEPSVHCFTVYRYSKSHPLQPVTRISIGRLYTTSLIADLFRPPGTHGEGPEDVSMSLSFLTVPLETNYLRMRWTDIQQIFRIATHMGGHMISPTSFARSLKRRCYGNRFNRESAKIGMLNFHSVHWHSTTDGKIATRMHALTTPMIPLRLIKNWRSSVQ